MKSRLKRIGNEVDLGTESHVMTQSSVERCCERQILLREDYLSHCVEAAIRSDGRSSGDYDLDITVRLYEIKGGLIALLPCFSGSLSAVYRAIERSSSIVHFDGWQSVNSCVHLHDVSEMLLGIVDVFANFSYQGLYLFSCPIKDVGSIEACSSLLGLS